MACGKWQRRLAFYVRQTQFVRNLQSQVETKAEKKWFYKNKNKNNRHQSVCNYFCVVLCCCAVLWPVSVGVALVHWNVPVLSCCHWYRCYTGFEPRKQTATNGSKLIGLLMNINKVQLIDFTDICTYIAGYVSKYFSARVQIVACAYIILCY